MKYILIAMTFVLSLVTSAVTIAFAEGSPTDAPAAQQAMPSTPPQEATPQQQIPPANLAAARRLVKALVSDETFNKTIDGMLPPLLGSLFANSSLSASQRASATKIITEEIKASDKQSLADAYSMMYARRLTRDDLERVASFYESPAGQRFIAAAADLAGERAQLSLTWARTVVVPRVTARMKELEAKPALLQP